MFYNYEVMLLMKNVLSCHVTTAGGDKPHSK